MTTNVSIPTATDALKIAQGQCATQDRNGLPWKLVEEAARCNQCKKNINSAYQKGDTQTGCYINTSQNCLDDVKKQGYRVVKERTEGSGEELYYKISWDPQAIELARRDFEAKRLE